VLVLFLTVFLLLKAPSPSNLLVSFHLSLVAANFLSFSSYNLFTSEKSP